jgi:hypothetical protein
MAAVGEHTRTFNGRPVGLDTRLPKMMGKLIIDVGVTEGGAYDFGLKHGFHVYGAKIPAMCDIAQTADQFASLGGPNHPGDCRLETFDGQDHSPTVTISAADSVAGKLKQDLADLQAQFPEEDWGYYLNADGSVRWSDIGITGYSHGATSAARWAKTVRLYRVVSRSGPRDNLCGQGATKPYDTNCPANIIATWINEATTTPIERYYGMVGNGDMQYGDILFAMNRMNYIGTPVDIGAGAPPYGDSHRMFINDGHSDFTDRKFWPALGVAWGVPPENMTYAAAH